jgi:hypothetical protein
VRNVAIECKNLSRVISQADLSTIYSDYLSLIETGEVSEVWVVARELLAGGAELGD